MNELEKIRGQEQKIDRIKMLHKRYKTMRSFGDAIRNGIIAMNMANVEQEQLAKKINEFAIDTKPRNLNMKKEKQIIQSSVLALLKVREMIFNVFKSGILPPHSDSKEPHQSEESDDKEKTITQSSSSRLLGFVHKLDVPPTPDNMLYSALSRLKSKATKNI